jgi:hypothetical protein
MFLDGITPSNSSGESFGSCARTLLNLSKFEEKVKLLQQAALASPQIAWVSFGQF